MNEPTSVLCPICAAALKLTTEPRRSLGCAAGHRFDAAKQGYFNFLTGKGTNFLEDTSPMVLAREEFQGRGHYAALASELATLVAERHRADSLEILDAGAGTGYYLGEILKQHPAANQDAVAMDISRFAMRRAAKLPDTLAIVWDVWRTIPSADQSRDVVLNCFAPHNPAEFRRVLRPDGLCLVVTGAEDHLEEVREPLDMLSVAGGKQQVLIEKFAAEGLRHVQSQNLRYSMNLEPADLYNLVFMGPAGHHLSGDTLRSKAENLGRRTVNASFDVHLFIPQA
ncbi:putative RNA methyltransferase [Glutamicibacter sp. NPDC087344]|uniref:putative RNA methyltransferase n=1 Tax=Glutamicibacter sp. NPDC087344 TaxID=3363994 RepID=UPI003818A041